MCVHAFVCTHTHTHTHTHTNVAYCSVVRRRLYAKGFVAQDFDEAMRGANLPEDAIRTDRPRSWLAYWDGITKDFGYTIFEAPEWPKPSKCAKNWGPTNERYAGRFKDSFANGRTNVPAVRLRTGHSKVPPGSSGTSEDRAHARSKKQKSWVFIFQGYKQGMQFLRTAFTECGAGKSAEQQISVVRVADEEDVHAIGLARDPMSKIVSAYKEILYRTQRSLRTNGDKFETDAWWHTNATSRYPGIEQSDSCMDWIFIGKPKDPKQITNVDTSSGMEAARFHAFLEALNCGCRYLDWMHVATSTWWMAMRRTVHETKKKDKSNRPPFEEGSNPIIGSLPLTVDAMSTHRDIRRFGYGAPHIDEVWNTENLSAEIVELIDRFNIPQNATEIGSRWGGTCENQSAKTYYGTTEQKDEKQKGGLAGPVSTTLRELLSEESTAQSICDSFAQDYICFGFEPPRECSELHSSMVKYDLILYEEGYQGPDPQSENPGGTPTPSQAPVYDGSHELKKVQLIADRVSQSTLSP